ncbi:hypothetical protein [Novosphingobium sp.]|uniref:hypothetical protein n=1 Tax=Novosphingobium sp. TaxID=1874826 RepID=UPI003D0C0AE2
MPLDRRQVLRSAPYFAATPLLLASSWAPLFAAKIEFPAALLVPKTGVHAALGRSMERAAMLAQGTTGAKQLLVFDTMGTPAGAIAATRAALRAKARIVLGPLLAGEVPGVVGAAGKAVPVLAFSNDAALRESGAFVLGITAAQSVTAVMRYAAGRGIRRLAVGGTGAWGAQVAAAAHDAARALNVEIVAMPGENPAQLPHMSSAGDGQPDAVLMADIAALAEFAPMLKDQGIQMLGAFSGLDFPSDTLRNIEGTWLAAPDPAGFAGFAHAFEDRNGSPPGIITALAYDAVQIVQQMRAIGGVDRSGLLAAPFPGGACGTVRFREDGSAARSLAILAVTNAALHVIAPPAP